MQTPDGSHVFDVKDFGAVGDGITDDTEAIRRAVAACAASGGGTIRLHSHVITEPIWTLGLGKSEAKPRPVPNFPRTPAVERALKANPFTDC